MAQPEDFISFNFPVVSPAALTCVGIRLCGDTTAWLHAVQQFVTEKERAHAQRFIHPMDALKHLVGRALVRRTLSASLQRFISEDFYNTIYGKPFWPYDIMYFSISHSANMVWTAYCRIGAVGIDIEEVRIIPDILTLAKIFHPEECEEIQRQPLKKRTPTFFRCWTRKEAVLKAIGKGLHQSLDSFQVQTKHTKNDWIISLPNERTKEQSTPSNSKWSVYDIDIDKEFHCSVAAITPDLTLDVLFIDEWLN